MRPLFFDPVGRRCVLLVIEVATNDYTRALSANLAL
jgi:hypothetical protein